MKETKDKFANKLYGSCTESAAGTLTFNEIQTNVDVFSKRAWVLHRLEWYIPVATRLLFVDGSDYIDCALVSSSSISSLELDNPAVIDLWEIQMYYGSNVGKGYIDMPMIRNFESLPGGGLIITPRPLFTAVKATSMATPVTVECRGYFTSLELSADEYLELVDFYRIVQ